MFYTELSGDLIYRSAIDNKPSMPVWTRFCWPILYLSNRMLLQKSLFQTKNDIINQEVSYHLMKRLSTGIDIVIFILANNFLRWPNFGPTRFIHRWTTLVHAPLRVRDLRHKWNSWLADVTFDWRHVMETAVERNKQTRGFMTFLRHLFCKILIKNKTSLFTNNEQKRCKNKV